MRIEEIKLNKKRYLPLLLLADEQEDMVERYLDKGIMYVLIDNGVKSECIITDEGNGNLEEVKRKAGTMDPYLWAKQYASKLTQEDKENNPRHRG